MGDVQALLSLHHQELDRLLIGLLKTEPDSREWWTGLDAARFGFGAHIDAEAKALVGVHRRTKSSELERLLTYIAEEHARQRQLLARLARVRDREASVADLLELRSALLSHDDQERLLLIPAIRDALPVAEYGRLARTYASERLFALGTMPLEVIRE